MYNITHDLDIGRLGVNLKIYLAHVPEDGDPVQDYVYTAMINTRGFSLEKEVMHDKKDTEKDVSELVDFETFLYPTEPSESEMKMLKLVHANSWGKVEDTVVKLCSDICVHWAGGHTEGTIQKLVYFHTAEIEKL